MKNIKISSQLSLSIISQGYWRLEDWGYTTDQLVYHMRGCVDVGVTTFDTAEIYSSTLCETLIGNALKKDKSLRKNIQIVSKTGIFQRNINDEIFTYYDTTYNRIVESCKDSLKRLKTDHIDLYLIHREDPCLNPWETAKALLDLKKEGLVLEIGVSNFDPFKFNALNKAVNGELVTNQIELNPICFEHLNSGMIDYLSSHNIHPMVWSPLAGGKFFSSSIEKYRKVMDKVVEVANRHSTDPSTIIYAWILYHPVQAMPIVGSKRLDRLEKAINALDVALEHWEWYEIYTASGQQVLR